MTTQTFDAFGGKFAINYDGNLVTEADQAPILDKIDIDLRADAAADPTKLSTVVFMMKPCDNNMCRWGTITANANILIHLIQDSLQAAMQEYVGRIDPNAKVEVPQTGVYDCKTAAYMVMAHQLITGSPVGDVAGWPLDATEFQALLGGSAGLYQAIQQMSENPSAFTGYSIVMPADTKGIKFHRAEVPNGCTVSPVVPTPGTRWGLVAAVGILVAGAVGATYAISQHRKHLKHSDAK